MKLVLLLILSACTVEPPSKQYYDIFRVGEKTPAMQCKQIYLTECGLNANECTDGSKWYCLINIKVRR